MKKFSRVSLRTSLLLLVNFLVVFTLLTNVACQQLTMDNLKANEHFQKGNKHYADEKYKKAVMEYEEAIKLNPDLKGIFFYAGTAYSQLYQPGSEDAKNISYGEKAIEFLNKAKENDPANDKIIMALGYIYNKMRKYEDAEQYFLQMLEKDKNNPQAYYILADFYSSYDQGEKAVETYQKRIDLDPSNPEGFLFLANYYQQKRLYDQALETHKKRIEVIEKSGSGDKENKKMLAEALYTYGVVCWAKAYNTPPEVLADKDRSALSDEGLLALDRAIEIDPLYPEPWAYKNLLFRQKAIAEPLNKQKYEAEADKMSKKFVELRKQKTAADALLKDLQKEQ